MAEQQVQQGQLRRTVQSQPAQRAVEVLVEQQVPTNRQEEIRRYLRLFGYKPDRSVLQVHVAGYFGRSRLNPTEVSSRQKASERYGGRTFTVVGRTHDPEILRHVILPKKKPEEANPGYVGYLFKEKDKEGKTPDKELPLDFTPAGLNYPQDWKNYFGTRGYLITMHVPANFAAKKNVINREIRRLKGKVNVKDSWNFIDQLEPYRAEAGSESTDTV